MLEEIKKNKGLILSCTAIVVGASASCYFSYLMGKKNGIDIGEDNILELIVTQFLNGDNHIKTNHKSDPATQYVIGVVDVIKNVR